jgi:23S rRNA pseudouridine1911/1915/1917 synthase
LQAFPRQALHAVELQFQHPRKAKLMRFKSEIPKDIKALIGALK